MSCIMDAMEGRYIATVNIPGDLLHSDMDDIVNIKIYGAVTELLTRVYPGQYEKYAVMEKGKKLFYVRLKKALYGTLKAALLLWENLSRNLMNEWGFKINLHEICVANKTIGGRKCTIIWNVDYLNISNVDSNVVDDIMEVLDKEYVQDP